MSQAQRQQVLKTPEKRLFTFWHALISHTSPPDLDASILYDKPIPIGPIIRKAIKVLRITHRMLVSSIVISAAQSHFVVQ